MADENKTTLVGLIDDIAETIKEEMKTNPPEQMTLAEMPDYIRNIGEQGGGGDGEPYGNLDVLIQPIRVSSGPGAPEQTKLVITERNNPYLIAYGKDKDQVISDLKMKSDYTQAILPYYGNYITKENSYIDNKFQDHYMSNFPSYFNGGYAKITSIEYQYLDDDGALNNKILWQSWDKMNENEKTKLTDYSWSELSSIANNWRSGNTAQVSEFENYIGQYKLVPAFDTKNSTSRHFATLVDINHDTSNNEYMTFVITNTHPFVHHGGGNEWGGKTVEGNETGNAYDGTNGTFDGSTLQTFINTYMNNLGFNTYAKNVTKRFWAHDIPSQPDNSVTPTLASNYYSDASVKYWFASVKEANPTSGLDTGTPSHINQQWCYNEDDGTPYALFNSRPAHTYVGSHLLLRTGAIAVNTYNPSAIIGTWDLSDVATNVINTGKMLIFLTL